MRLSEAIRLGAMIRPQGFGVGAGRDQGSCALQAAEEAVLGTFVATQYGAYAHLWPWTVQQAIPCPVCGEPGVASLTIGYHLNDQHRWTRERIAAWVEGVEPREVREAMRVDTGERVVEGTVVDQGAEGVTVYVDGRLEAWFSPERAGEFRDPVTGAIDVEAIVVEVVEWEALEARRGEVVGR